MKIFNSKLLSLAAIIIAFVIAFSIFTSVALQHIEKNSKQYINESLRTVLLTTQDALHIWLKDQLEKLSLSLDNQKLSLLTEQLLREYKQQHNLADSALRNQLNTLLKKALASGDYKDFAIITPDKITIAAMNTRVIGSENIINKQRKYYLDRAFSGDTLFIPTVISDLPVLNQNGKQTTNLTSIYIAAPITDADKKIIAVIAFAVNPKDHFSHIMLLGRIGKTGETYAFDNTARLITKSRFNKELQTDGEISNDEDATMEINITDPGINLLKHPAQGITKQQRPLTFMARQAIAQNFAPHYEAYRDYRGVRVFGVWLWDKLLDIGITTEIEESEALLPHNETRETIYIVLLFVVALSIGLIILFMIIKEKEKQLIIAHKERLEELVNERTDELEKSNQELKKLSEVDPLTRIANRRAYNDELKAKVLNAYRTAKPLSLLVIDIDFFKLFNDNYGHDTGDNILYQVAQIITNALPRGTDMVARYGGEEFVVLLPATDSKGAFSVAERIRLNIELEALEHKYSEIANTITVSIGVTTLTLEEDKLTGNELFKRADSALYRAKEQGRNKSIIYQQ